MDLANVKLNDLTLIWLRNDNNKSEGLMAQPKKSQLN